MSKGSQTKLHAGRWVIGVFAVLVLYVFSYAPVTALTTKYAMSHSLPFNFYAARTAFYSPLSCIMHTPLSNVFMRYQVWWWQALDLRVCMPLP